MKKIIFPIVAIILAGVLSLAVLLYRNPHQHHDHDHHDHDGHHHEESAHSNKVQLDQDALFENGITIEIAGQQTIPIKLKLNGKIVPNENLHIEMVPRFPGIVKEIRKKLGDKVQKNDVLAIIESNESLRDYELKSPISGTVLKKDLNVGELVSGSEKIFTIADLTTVWADMHVFPKDASSLKEGQVILIKASNSDLSQLSKIFYLSSVNQEKTQSIIARAEVANPNGEWRPGMFVTGEVTIEEVNAEVALKTEALQTLHNEDVAFIQIGNTFQAVPLKLGKRNEEWVEVLSGISQGDRYASKNSYILKADIGKSEAEHEH